jgi:hypothetical protein
MIVATSAAHTVKDGNPFIIPRLVKIKYDGPLTFIALSPASYCTELPIERAEERRKEKCNRGADNAIYYGYMTMCSLEYA